MHKLAIAGALACVLPFGLSGCDNTLGPLVSVAAGDIANVVSHSQQACSDLAMLGSSAVTVAQQVAAANPNNASLQSAAQTVINGGAAANNQCQELAAAFTAEAPRSLLTKKVKLPVAVWARLK